MLQFVAKVRAYNSDSGEYEEENLLLSNESFERAIREIEGWYEQNLMSVNITCLTNKPWLVVDDASAKKIMNDPENQEFW